MLQQRRNRNQPPCLRRPVPIVCYVAYALTGGRPGTAILIAQLDALCNRANPGHQFFCGNRKDRAELSDGPTVSLDHELFAAFDAIDQIGETRLHR